MATRKPRRWRKLQVYQRQIHFVPWYLLAFNRLRYRVRDWFINNFSI